MYEIRTNHQLFEKMLSDVTDVTYGPWREYKCLLWTRGKQKGYGMVHLQIPGDKKWKMARVHRLAYEKINGPIPSSIDVCHHCDTPACFHPAHLFLGTRTDNMQDCAAKGRSRKGRLQVTTMGAKNPFSKLTDEQVLEIRALYRKGAKKEIAALGVRFGVDKTHIWRIGARKAWTHI